MNVPLLEHLRANYEVVAEIDDGKKLEVRTYAVIEPHTVAVMAKEGWKQLSPTVLVWEYEKPQINLSVKGSPKSVPVKPSVEDLVTPRDDVEVE